MYQATQETGRFHNALSSFELRCGAYVRVKSVGHFGIVVRSRSAGVNHFVNLVKICAPVPELHPVYEFAESQALQAIT